VSTEYTVTVNALPTATMTPTTLCAGASLTAGGGTKYKWTSGSTATTASIKPTTSGTYTVDVTNAQGCTATKSETITVNPLPVVTLSALPVNICKGGDNTVTLTATSTNEANAPVKTYAWSSNAAGVTGTTGTVKPTSTQTYEVTPTSEAGCVGTKVTAKVTEYSVTVKLDGKSVSYDGSTTLSPTVTGLPTGTTVASYEWSPAASISGGAGTATITTANLKATTEYTVVVKDSEGCSGTAKASVSVTGGALSVNPTGGDKLYCLGTQAVSGLSAGDSGGSGDPSYEWSSTPDGLVLSGGRTPQIQPNSKDGTYSVTVKVTKGSETLSKTLNNVKVYKTPVLGTISVSSTDPKEGDVVELTLASVDPETASLSWTSTGTPLASTSGLKVSTGKLTSGGHTYKVEADNNECKASKLVNVNVGKMADIVITPPATTPKGNIGEEFTATVTVTGGTGTYDKYTWTAPAGVTIKGDGPTATISSADPGSKEICVEVLSGGVTAKRCFNVVVTDPSKIGLTLSVDKKCAYEGEELTITIVGNGADTYSFSLRDQSNAEVMKVADKADGPWLYKVKADQAGTYKIADFKYKISGVESTGDIVEPVTALFDPVPDVKAQVDGLASIDHCDGDELTLKGTSCDTEGLPYTWDNGV
ncbi:MAG: hypothetical protein K2M86_00295, partial [Odoribacter sp.]|nr:hypothetical protein [Odoribacter sp.]